MSLLKRLDFPEMKFSLYFLGYENVASAPADPVKRTEWTFGQKATLELTHNWGTENDPEFKGYHNGNSDPRGFGHIGITVDDVYKACERFEHLGVEFVKKPDDGKMKGIAFIKDPDGYWIEIFDLNRIGEIETICHGPGPFSPTGHLGTHKYSTNSPRSRLGTRALAASQLHQRWAPGRNPSPEEADQPPPAAHRPPPSAQPVIRSRQYHRLLFEDG
ncbi:hypothetical protein GUJ93_ZPchr0010g8035 [Zizania palustris]|uniref:Lactoylglutathione lyase n=1 Tax=Zizania palustris TaxID=103762 RepID=A0A8J5W8W7_ZIZPA|nr:hypothetical protein GUJ93_ZPchr0010g8035 [Zizania palustris]